MTTPPSLPRYTRGSIVEISSQDEGFKGSYYVATIVARLSPESYTVQYATLLDDDPLDPNPLREVVSPSDIRPAPPVVDIPDGFVVGDQVEANDNDGWWAGTVIERRMDDSYFVRFEESGEEVWYERGRLRAHLEWEEGKWVRPPRKPVAAKVKREVVVDWVEVEVVEEVPAKRTVGRPRGTKRFAG